MFDVPGGHFCAAPQILWFDKRKDDYKFDIQPSCDQSERLPLSFSVAIGCDFRGRSSRADLASRVRRRTALEHRDRRNRGSNGTCTTTGDQFSTSGSSQPYDCH